MRASYLVFILGAFNPNRESVNRHEIIHIQTKFRRRNNKKVS